MDGRRWKKCPKGHVLGEIVRVEVCYNGKKRFATRLRLYRHAVYIHEAANGQVGAILEGNAPELECDLCNGEKRKAHWEIGKEALEHLLEELKQSNRKILECVGQDANA